jgi:hypothetical protein
VRIIGIILIILGALSLGYETYRVEHEKARGNQNPGAGRTVWIPPVVGGIALVSGLLLTAVATRPRDE